MEYRKLTSAQLYQFLLSGEAERRAPVAEDMMSLSRRVPELEWDMNGHGVMDAIIGARRVSGRDVRPNWWFKHLAAGGVLNHGHEVKVVTVYKLGDDDWYMVHMPSRAYLCDALAGVAECVRKEFLGIR